MFLKTRFWMLKRVSFIMNDPSNANLVLWYRSTRCLQSSCSLSKVASTGSLSLWHYLLKGYDCKNLKTKETCPVLWQNSCSVLSVPWRIYYVNVDCWSTRPEQAITDSLALKTPDYMGGIYHAVRTTWHNFQLKLRPSSPHTNHDFQWSFR